MVSLNALPSLRQVIFPDVFLMINKQELWVSFPRESQLRPTSHRLMHEEYVLYTATQQRVSVKCSAQAAEEIKVSYSAIHSVVCTSRLYKGKCLVYIHVRTSCISEFL